MRGRVGERSAARGRLVFVFLAGLVAVLLTIPAGALGTSPKALWQRCDGSPGDLSCNIPRGIGVSPTNGHLYVADQSRSRIDEYTAWGEFVRAWGWGVADGAAEPQVCTVASSCQAGIPGGGRGQMVLPQGVAVDPAGIVYVVEGDFSGKRVQKFGAAGNFIVMFGAKVNKTKVEEGKPAAEQNRCPVDPADICQAAVEGTGPGEFGPFVAGSFIVTGSAASNVVYVGDKNRVQVFNPDGSFKEAFPNPDGITSACNVQSLIAAPSNGLYLTCREKADVWRLTAAGKKSCTVNESNPTAPLKAPTALAMALNAEGKPTGGLYVYDGTDKEVRQFNPNCVEKGAFTGGSFAKGEISVSTGLAASVACLESGTVVEKGPDVFISNSLSGNGYVRAYGPAPDKTALCPKPLFAPVILAQYATSVGTVEATLGTEVNPRFYADTTFQLQYGTAACIDTGGWEAPCVTSKLASPASLGAEAVDFPQSSPIVEIEGLAPATAYRYRFISQSAGGGPVVGPERSFSTFPWPFKPASCPNDVFRTGGAALLPDCRAYELVSPLDKEGGEIVTFGGGGFGRPAALNQSAITGDKLTYSSYTPFAGAESAPYTSQYIASRKDGVGWSSEAISPPRGTNFTPVGGDPFPGGKGEFEAFSADLCRGWLLHDNTTAPVLAAGAEPFNGNYYRRENCGAGAGSYEGLSRTATATPVHLQGVSVDGEEAIFRTDVHLSQDAPSAVGTTLNCESPTPVAVSFQWLREGAPIAGATTDTYIAKAADEGKAIQCQMRTSGGGAGTVGDATPAFVIAPYPAMAPPLTPQSIAAPSTSEPLEVGGAGGQTLRCDPNATAWGGSSVFAYRWYRNGEAIAGAESPEYAVQAADLASAATLQCEVIGTNAGGTVAKASEALASSPAPGTPVARPNMATNQPVVYETDGDGEVRAVCILPSGMQSNGCTAGTANQFSVTKSTSSDTVDGALSEDGERVFWTNSNNGEGTIYARIGGKTTVGVSEAAGVGNARFWLAAADGSRAIISSAGKLYEVELSDPEAPVATLVAEGFAGVVGASEDASRLYFASTKALTGAEANTEGAVAQVGQPNLYLRRADAGGEALGLIGTLAGADIPTANTGSNGLSPVAVEPYEHAARTSEDGTYVAFMSRASLTGYDNADAVSGEADAEVFVYDAATGQLRCASCNPSGARPVGQVVVTDKPLPTAARLPLIGSQLHTSRVLAEDGSRLFFESIDPLVLADTNGRIDVYEWEVPGAGSCKKGGPGYSVANEGCVNLISSGKSTVDSTLLDASPIGRDIFFTTGASLVLYDPGSIDIYNAREGGGLPPPAPGLKPPCEGDACQSPPPAPAEVTPASVAFSGAGNVKPRKRCGKGRRRVVRKGKARCVKRKATKRRRALRKRGWAAR